VSHYIKPKREYYASEREYKDALEMNGGGEKTFFGDKAEEGIVAADVDFKERNKKHKGQFKRGTILYFVELKRIFVVNDRCREAEKYSKKGKVLFDIFSKNMTPEEAFRRGKYPATVQIWQPV